MIESKKEARKGVCHECGYVLTNQELNNLRNAKEPKCPKCLAAYPIVQCVPNKHKYRLIIEGPPCPIPNCHSQEYRRDC